MRDEMIRRDYFWIVEAIDKQGKVLYNCEYKNFERAWEKYFSLKGLSRKATISIQRRYKEYKIV